VAEIGAFEAKNTLGALLDRVGRGEEIVITPHGRAVARLVPHEDGIHRNQAQAAAEGIRARARRRQLGCFDWAARQAGRDEGRP